MKKHRWKFPKRISYQKSNNLLSVEIDEIDDFDEIPIESARELSKTKKKFIDEI